MIKDLKARNAFTSDEYYSRLKAKYSKYSKVEIDSEDIISEISEKVGRYTRESLILFFTLGSSYSF